MERAKQYGMRMATHEEALELAKSKATRVAGTNKIPLFTYDEIVFVDSSVKGEDVLTFMKSIYIANISFRFMAKNDWKETMLTGIGSTGTDTSTVERDFVKVLDDMILHAAH